SRTDGRQAVGRTSDGGGHVALLFWPPVAVGRMAPGSGMAGERGTGETSGKAPFARLVATLDYPLYIVTTAVGQERSGCLIGFATQCSIHPPRFLACISKKNHTFGLVQRAAIVAVHVVDEKNRQLAELFGGETGDELDKFSQVDWHSVDGVPVLDACERWFAGSVLERI